MSMVLKRATNILFEIKMTPLQEIHPVECSLVIIVFNSQRKAKPAACLPAKIPLVTSPPLMDLLQKPEGLPVTTRGITAGASPACSLSRVVSALCPRHCSLCEPRDACTEASFASK